jgi:hypothetical protein
MKSASLLLLVFAAGAIASASSSPGAPNPLPVAQRWIYEPLSNNTDFTLGEMVLSTTYASFSVLHGHMNLEFAGTTRDPERLGTSDARVYRVKNAQQYFQLNRGANGFCEAPITWFGVAPITLNWNMHDGFGGDVRIFLMTIGDYRRYRPDKLGLCSADTFRPSKRA